MKNFALLHIVLVPIMFQPSTAAVFNFDDISPGTAIPFAISAGTMTATFRSPSGPVFNVDTAFFNTLTGNVVFDNDGVYDELDIIFNAPITNITLLFALNADRSLVDTFTMQAFLGGLTGTSVGSVSGHGIIPVGSFYPEGSLSFGGRNFDAVKLTSTAVDFAIDDVHVNNIPEPSSFSFIGLGILSIAAGLKTESFYT